MSPGQYTRPTNKNPLFFSDPLRMIDFKYSQGVNGSFTLHNVSVLLKALQSFALLCFSDSIVVNRTLLGIKKQDLTSRPKAEILRAKVHQSTRSLKNCNTSLWKSRFQKGLKISDFQKQETEVYEKSSRVFSCYYKID